MPIHDWSQVDHGVFHDFHQAWTIGIRNALNRGALPSGFFAMAEQVTAGPVPDVVTLQRGSRQTERDGGLAVADVPPRAAYVTSAEWEPYAARANRIAVRHRLGRSLRSSRSSRRATRAASMRFGRSWKMPTNSFSREFTC